MSIINFPKIKGKCMNISENVKEKLNKMDPGQLNKLTSLQWSSLIDQLEKREEFGETYEASIIEGVGVKKTKVPENYNPKVLDFKALEQAQRNGMLVGGPSNTGAVLRVSVINPNDEVSMAIDRGRRFGMVM